MREIKNVPMSVQTRLLNLAKSQGKPFQEILQYYGIERFLFRLSKTDHSASFVLKGGLIFYALHFSLRRVTRDIDFRSYTRNSTDNLTAILHAVFTVQVPYDGLEFREESLRFEEILVDADYKGVRISFLAYLGTTRIPLHIDVGFADVITPETLSLDYPCLLEGMETPILKGYPTESIVSEKFQAMVRLADINSRWKDFYDLWLLSEETDFEGRTLQKALMATFEQRETAFPVDVPIALTESFARARQKQWQIFLKKNGIFQENNQDFFLVIERLRAFLLPPMKAIVEATSFEMKWKARGDWHKL